VSIEREVFPAMVAELSLYALHSDSYWIDAGTPVTYLDAQLDLIDGVRGSAERAVHETATIEDGAVIDHSVVMAGVVVESGAIVRNSVLLPGSRIGADAHVVHSVIGAGAEVGAESEVLDYTVVGNSRDVPAGARLEGARFPEGS
jgi:mannose-1-phosphate guanylyltransferase